MVKVIHSQIPETSGKPVYPDKKPKRVTRTTREEWDDEEDDDPVESSGGSSEDEGEDVIKRMITFPDSGISISFFGIESIEKDVRFMESPKAHWEYGIVINKGMSPSIRFPKVDVEMWFKNEEFRDQRWDSMMEVLKKEGYKVTEIR